MLWKSPRVIVRRAYLTTEVWLDEDDLSFMKSSKFSVNDQVRILALVRDNFDDLLMWWCTLKNDVRRGWLEHNVFLSRPCELH